MSDSVNENLTNAEPAEVTRVRMLTGEMTGSDWTTETISGILAERNGDIYAAAADLWKYKAAALAANPVKFSADGGTYDFTEAYQHCLDESARCLAMSPSIGGMIVDPTLKPVEAA